MPVRRERKTAGRHPDRQTGRQCLAFLLSPLLHLSARSPFQAIISERHTLPHYYYYCTLHKNEEGRLTLYPTCTHSNRNDCSLSLSHSLSLSLFPPSLPHLSIPTVGF